MACRPYNTGRCLLLRLFNPSKLWGSLQNRPLIYALIVGHRDLNPMKDCPCFDSAEYADIQPQ